MSLVYRKRGRALRIEVAHGRTTRLVVEESGTAHEEGRVFRCESALHDDLFVEALDAQPLERLVRRVREAIAAPLELERLVATDGHARHAFGDERWGDRHARLHVAVVHRPWKRRLLLELGADEPDAIALDDLHETVQAMTAAAPCRSTRVADVVLLSLAAAPLVPLLARLGDRRIQQQPQPFLDRDGDGRPIVRAAADDAGWPPNRFRPSYRHRAVRLPFHVTLPPFGTMTSAAYEAVASLAPPQLVGDGLFQLQLLLRDSGGACVASLRFRSSAIVAAAGAPRWYPIEAGVVATRLLVRDAHVDAALDAALDLARGAERDGVAAAHTVESRRHPLR